MRFWKRTSRVNPPAPKPTLPPAAAARMAREAEEARLDAERRQAAAEEIRRACERVGYYWPGEAVPEGRLSGTSWRQRILRTLFDGWR